MFLSIVHGGRGRDTIGDSTIFGAFDLDLHPMILILKLDLDYIPELSQWDKGFKSYRLDSQMHTDTPTDTQTCVKPLPACSREC